MKRQTVQTRQRSEDWRPVTLIFQGQHFVSRAGHQGAEVRYMCLYLGLLFIIFIVTKEKHINSNFTTYKMCTEGFWCVWDCGPFIVSPCSSGKEVLGIFKDVSCFWCFVISIFSSVFFQHWLICDFTGAGDQYADQHTNSFLLMGAAAPPLVGSGGDVTDCFCCCSAGLFLK